MGDDSSPDLSLKLRRGSSDSRDSFYMDFDRGIDSDIDEMATTSGAEHGDTTAETTATPTALGQGRVEGASWPTIPPQNMSGGSRSTAMGGGDPLLPSPASPVPIIVSPETLSHSSPSKSTRQSAHVQIAPPPKSISPGPLAITGYFHQQQPSFPIARRLSRAEKQEEWRQLGSDALATTLSALYGKLLVVMGTAFPMAEVISTYIPPSFYEAYYLYLYIGSMFFLLYMYVALLRDKRRMKNRAKANLRPFALKRYDQTEILPDEDRREILRDIKTIYAPEYRLYVNESVNKYINQEKREVRSYDVRGYTRRHYTNTSRENPIKIFLVNEHRPESRQEDVWEEPKTIILNDDDVKNNSAPSSNNVEIPFMNGSFVEDLDLKELLYTENTLNLLSNISNKTDVNLLNVVTEIYRTTEESEENKKVNILQEPFSWTSIENDRDIRSFQGKTMRSYMNPKVDPCTDFYEYACGSWKNTYTIPPDRATYDTFEMVRENLDYMLKDILHNIREPPMNSTYPFFTNFLDKDFRPHDTSDATVKAKNFYKSCIREDILDKRGDEPLRRILEQLGGWPIVNRNWTADNFDVIWLMARLRLLNNDVLIAQWVGPDMKNSHEYIVHLDQAPLGLPAREYYLDDVNIKYISAYKVFILTIAQLMGAQSLSSEKDVEDIIQFEAQLAQIMASTEERRNISDVYLRTDLAALSLYFPQFDWKNYFSITLGDDINLKTPVACYCARYLHELLYLLSNTEPRTLQNYLLWRFVRHRTNNLDHRFTEAKQRFYYILFGREKPPPRWQFCVFEVNSNMGMALGSLFVRKYFDQSSKSDTIEMTKELQNAFKKTLSENSWLDEHTKDYARMKLDNMDLKIGYPDFILNETQLAARYYDVQIHPDYFFENILTVLRHTTRIEQKRMGTEVNKTLWSTPPAVVNAYYSRNKNQIMFPAGILQPPFYNRHFPKALNFGGIGVVIGHEITHGFDDKGRLFDHEGNLHMWWRESSIEKFYEKSQCLIDQYDQYVLPEIKIALDGYLTQGENIADNGGLKQAFRAYDTWLMKNLEADETLPGLNLTGKQLFFLNFAQVWCGQQRIEAAESRIKTSVHSPGIFRVIGALSNSQEFAKAYDCPKNSPMNPDYKCIIW